MSVAAGLLVLNIIQKGVDFARDKLEKKQLQPKKELSKSDMGWEKKPADDSKKD